MLEVHIILIEAQIHSKTCHIPKFVQLATLTFPVISINIQNLQ